MQLTCDPSPFDVAYSNRQGFFCSAWHVIHHRWPLLYPSRGIIHHNLPLLTIDNHRHHSPSASIVCSPFFTFLTDHEPLLSLLMTHHDAPIFIINHYHLPSISIIHHVSTFLSIISHHYTNLNQASSALLMTISSLSNLHHWLSLSNIIKHSSPFFTTITNRYPALLIGGFFPRHSPSWSIIPRIILNHHGPSLPTGISKHSSAFLAPLLTVIKHDSPSLPKNYPPLASINHHSAFLTIIQPPHQPSLSFLHQVTYYAITPGSTPNAVIKWLWAAFLVKPPQGRAPKVISWFMLVISHFTS